MSEESNQLTFWSEDAPVRTSLSPDLETDIKPKGKPTADGSRYKALGNSMGVNCMRWIGMRIQMMEETAEGGEIT